MLWPWILLVSILLTDSQYDNRLWTSNHELPSSGSVCILNLSLAFYDFSYAIIHLKKRRRVPFLFWYSYFWHNFLTREGFYVNMRINYTYVTCIKIFLNSEILNYGIVSCHCSLTCFKAPLLLYFEPEKGPFSAAIFGLSLSHIDFCFATYSNPY